MAQRTGCTPAAVLSAFDELASSAALRLQRAQHPNAAEAQRTLAAAAAARQTARAKLQALLGEGGGLRDMRVTGELLCPAVRWHPCAAFCRSAPLPTPPTTHPCLPAHAAGQFASLLASLSSGVVRGRAAAAVVASTRAVRAKLLATG